MADTQDEPKAPKAEWRGRKYGHSRFEFLEGIPARDLSEDEFNDLTPEQQAAVEGSKLYRVAKDTEEPDGTSGDRDAAALDRAPDKTDKPGGKPSDTKKEG